LFLNVLDLLLRGFALLTIQFHCRHSGQPPLSTVHNRSHHLQVAQ
jgi:hypothetical protein